LDIGSTTTDIIPLLNGVPIPFGLTDRERLASGELVYTGVRRTPLCAISQMVPFRGTSCPVAAELFATALDVYLMLGRMDEDPSDTDTANGKPATKACAHDRLARTICCDRSEVTPLDALAMAEQFARAQRRQIASAIGQVLANQTGPVSNVLISGSGSFLAEALCDELPELRSAKRVCLRNLFADRIAEAACAFALARLAEERVPLG
jgi:probable H4MPT-linked C1 transfer pathway protein